MAAAELLKAKGRSTHLKCLLSELKQQLDHLTSATIKGLCTEEEKKLQIENDLLKIEVNQLKQKLVQLETKNNVKQIALPNKSSCKNMQATTNVSRNVTTEKIITNGLHPVAITDESKNKVAKIEQKSEKIEKKTNNKDGNKSSAKLDSKALAGEECVDASRLNMRIGRIVEVQKHPDADSLYVETVDVGEPKPRTIVSGLVNHIPIEQMRDRIAVFLLNLKPAKMRGVLSEGMIMCASTPEKVEVISVPDGAVIGERVTVDGYAGEPDEQLNPKKKIWEQIQPDLKINSEGLATYKGALWISQKGANFKAATMKNCPIK